MLTENELQWLYAREKRHEIHGAYFCNYCQFCNKCYEDEIKTSNSLKCEILDTLSGYKEAAMFEARVAAKLSDSCWHSYIKWETPIKPNLTLFQRSKDRLKHARIEVEEEMENEY